MFHLLFLMLYLLLILTTASKVGKRGHKMVPSEDKHLYRRPTISGEARDRSGRRGRGYLYPTPSIPGQTSLFLSSCHLLSLM
jgi:hypothetical protein